MIQDQSRTPKSRYETYIIDFRDIKQILRQNRHNTLCLALISLNILFILGLLFTVVDPVSTAEAALSKVSTDIVYSARYYKPGMQRSHYKIWRTDLTGTKRIQVTSGKAEDRSPIWMADGKTIIFVREKGKTRTLCSVNRRGGPVTKLAVLPPGYSFIESVAPDRSMIVYLVYDPYSKLVVFNIAQKEHWQLGNGHNTSWSPDSRRLYITSWEKGKRVEIRNVKTGDHIPLAGDLRAATWLDNNTLVAEPSVEEQAKLIVLSANGQKQREVLLPFMWSDETDDLSPFADKLFAIKGDANSILYGRHAGNSTAGAAQKFFHVNVTDGKTVSVANGRNLAWSPDHRLFLTGDGRHLEQLDRKRRVWVSPLSIVSLATGKVRTIVQGLVDVGDFDWMPNARST